MLAVVVNCRLNRYYTSFLPPLFLSPYGDLAHSTAAALQSSRLKHTHMPEGRQNCNWTMLDVD